MNHGVRKVVAAVRSRMSRPCPRRRVRSSRIAGFGDWYVWLGLRHEAFLTALPRFYRLPYTHSLRSTRGTAPSLPPAPLLGFLVCCRRECAGFASWGQGQSPLTSFRMPADGENGIGWRAILPALAELRIAAFRRRSHHLPERGDVLALRGGGADADTHHPAAVKHRRRQVGGAGAVDAVAPGPRVIVE